MLKLTSILLVLFFTLSIVMPVEAYQPQQATLARYLFLQCANAQGDELVQLVSRSVKQWWADKVERVAEHTDRLSPNDAALQIMAEAEQWLTDCEIPPPAKKRIMRVVRAELTTLRMEGRDLNRVIDTPLIIGKGESALMVPNRRLAQPMERNNCPGGHVSSLSLKSYADLAKLGYGVVSIEAASIGPIRARYNQLRIGKEYKAGIERLVSHIRENTPFGDDVVVCIQPNHSGSISDPRFSDIVRTYLPREGDPDAIPGKLLTNDDISDIVNSFADAAEVAYHAGANMVDIKCCHGYLLGQFLRPANETRKNWDYGGSLDNRTRIVREILEEIRRRVPDERFKIMIRLSLVEGIMGGIGSTGPNSSEIDLAEPLEMVRRFAQAGAQIINVSAGIPKFNAPQWVRPVKKPKVTLDKQGLLSFHHINFAKLATDTLEGMQKEDVVVVGSGFSAFMDQQEDVAEAVLTNGYAKLAGFGRQSLAGRAMCGLCSGCSRRLLESPVGCVQGHENRLYGLLDSVRKDVKKAVLKNTFSDELGKIERIVSELPELADETEEIVQYIHTFIARQVFLGYLDAMRGVINRLQEVMLQTRIGDLDRASMDDIDSNLAALMNANQVFIDKRDADDNFRALGSIVEIAIKTDIESLIEVLEEISRPSENFIERLIEIREAIAVLQELTSYPQFKPEMIESVGEGLRVGTIALTEKAHAERIPQAPAIAPSLPSKVIPDVKNLTHKVDVSKLLGSKGPIEIKKTAVVIKKGLTDVSHDESRTTLGTALRQEYQRMHQSLRSLFSHEQGFTEVERPDEVSQAVNRLNEQGFKVIVLGDGTFARDLERGDFVKPVKPAKENWCIVSVELMKQPDPGAIQFVNLNAMALLGIGILHNDPVLFKTAYKLLTGEEASTDLVKAMRNLWFIHVLPRIVKFTDSIQDIEKLRRLFKTAA